MLTVLGYQNADFRNLNLHSALIRDYCKQKAELNLYFQAYPSVENVVKQCAEKKACYTQEQRAKLCAYMQKLHQNLNLTPLQQQQLTALENPNTFTITTAQQANLYSGPLYTIYKILHCIRIAQELSQSLPELHFVPIFFIGSEDHDTAELNHIFLHERKFSWQSEQDGAFGRRKVDRAFEDMLQKILNELNSYPHFEEIRELLKNYKPERKISEAHLHFLQFLFKDYGLLFIDPDDRNLKTDFISIFKDDIFQKNTQKLVFPRVLELEKLGYKAQVIPREINTFYLGENLRSRIVQLQNGNFNILGTKIEYTEAELEQIVANYPENFSPNVCLRGLFQEIILPSIAYVGGSGELAYWLELKPLFDYYKIPFPLLWLRHSVLILTEHNWVKKIEKAGLSLADILQKPQDYANNFVRKQNPKYSQIIYDYTQEFGAVYQRLSTELKEIPLTTHLKVLEHKNTEQLSKLLGKIYRHQKTLEKIQLERQAKLHRRVFPNGILQERHANILEFYAKYGADFIKTVFENMQDFDKTLIHLLCLS